MAFPPTRFASSPKLVFEIATHRIVKHIHICSPKPLFPHYNHKVIRTTTEAMPFNLFKSASGSKDPDPKSSSSLTTTTFPSPELTYTLAASLLHNVHPITLAHITAADTQQFLTKLYGYEPSLHWTWIALTFPSKDILSVLSSSSAVPRSTRKSLQSFIKQQQSDELERKGRYYSSQGWDAGNAYKEGEERRVESEVGKLERIMEMRREKLPLVVRYIYTNGHPIVWREREGDSEDDNLRKKNRAN
ncbi:MAG: hypothetical protein Q9198_009609 [Flavoplaca austrocitrina]